MQPNTWRKKYKEKEKNNKAVTGGARKGDDEFTKTLSLLALMLAKETIVPAP